MLLSKIGATKNARLASSNVQCQEETKIKTEIPKKEVKADAMETERHKVAGVFALHHLFAEDCRGYGDY